MSESSRPLVAGLTTALVGSMSSFAVVLSGLHAVGASPAEAGSGLLAAFLTMGLGTVLLSVRTRLPVTLAWSTPGAALLVGTGAVSGGWPAAVGAFGVSGVLICLTAVWPGLGALIGRIPVALAQAMLAGVLLGLCLAPVRAAVADPVLVLPVIVLWLVCQRLAPRWATPVAFGLALAIIAVDLGLRSAGGIGFTDLLPRPVWTTPRFTVGAVIGLALPLYVVTMASQNVPGVAVLRSFGYTAPWRPTMAVTGIGTLAGAPFGALGINFAAITAALAAAPDADPDPSRRWRAARTAGCAYLVLGLLSGALVALLGAAPPGLVETAAGLGLLPTLAGAISAALTEPADRIPAAATFLVAAGGVAVLGIGPAFWALVVGLLGWAVLRLRRRP